MKRTTATWLVFFLATMMPDLALGQLENRPEWVDTDNLEAQWPSDQYLHGKIEFSTTYMDGDDMYARRLKEEEQIKSELGEAILNGVRDFVPSESAQLPTAIFDMLQTAEGFDEFEVYWESDMLSVMSTTTKNFNSKRDEELHVLVVLNRGQTSNKLLQHVAQSLATTSSQFVGALERGETVEEDDMESILGGLSWHMRTALWLDTASDLSAVTRAIDQVSELVVLLQEQELERAFRDAQSELLELIQQGEHEESVWVLEDIEESFEGKEELGDLRHSVQQGYLRHVQSSCLNQSPTECMEGIEGYLDYFPEDQAMQKELTSLRQAWFDDRIELVELHLQHANLTDAREVFNQVLNQPELVQHPVTLQVGKRLSDLELIASSTEEIVALVPQGRHLEALSTLDELKREVGEREELVELRKSVQQNYQRKIRQTCPTQLEQECMNDIAEYLKFFPDDESMAQELALLKRTWFDAQIELVHNHIDMEKLTSAREVYDEIAVDSELRSLPAAVHVESRLKDAEREELIANLIQKSDAGQFFTAWTELQAELQSDVELANHSDILELREKLGTKCKKEEFKLGRRDEPFGWMVAISQTARSNGRNLSPEIASPPFMVVGAMQGYSFGVYSRTVPKDKISLDHTKRKKDHSSGYSLLGVRLTMWDGATYQVWEPENSDTPSLLDQSGQRVSAGFSMVHDNFWDVEVGVQLPLSAPNDEGLVAHSDAYVSLGGQIQLLTFARSRIHVRSGASFLFSTNLDPRMHLDMGLGWTPMFGARIPNKESIQAKYL